MSILPCFALLLFRITVIWPVGNLFLRFVPTNFALAIMKRLKLDVRAAWDLERLVFLSNVRFSYVFRMRLLFCWSIITRPGLGLAWGCAMESSYRIYSLAWFAFGPDKCELTAKHVARIEKMIQREMIFVQSNLETHSFNNHYAFNVFSLLIAHTVMNYSDNPKWIVELRRILRTQFLPDGSNFEGSSSYHLLMMEALARLAILRPDLKDLIKASMNIDGAFLFSKRIAPNGELLWRIGDTDGSSVVHDDRSVIELMLEAKLVTQYPAKEGFDFENFSAAFFDHGSLSFALWMPHPGQNGRAGHNHADALTLTCAIDGRAVIGDPGVPLYSFMRSQFRSAQNHSGLFPRGLEPLREVGTFKTADHWTGSLHRLSSDQAAATCERISGEAYSRKVKLSSVPGFEVEDSSTGCLPPPSPRLVLEPGNKIILETPLKARVIRKNGPDLIIEAQEGIDAFRLRRSWYAPQYFQLLLSTVLEMDATKSSCRWRVFLA